VSRRKPGSVESYAHKAAKAALVSWFREVAVHDECCKAAGVHWRVNRGAPWFGIWEEYPICSDEDCTVWDESGWWISLEGIRTRQLAREIWRDENWIDPSEVPWLVGRQPIPTYAELIELGTPPQLILDVAVQHKGCITAAFEIVHRHGLTDKKRDLLRGLHCTTYVVSADWVLAQVRPPERLVVLEAVNHGSYTDDVVLATRRRRREWA